MTIIPENKDMVKISINAIPSKPIGSSVGLNLNIIDTNAQDPNEENQPNTVKFSPRIIDVQDPKKIKMSISLNPTEEPSSMLPVPPHLSKPVKEKENSLTKTTIGNRKIYNWFTGIIDKYGEDYFTTRLTVEEVSRNAERIINEMIGGRINYEEFGKYIIIPTIIDTLVNYCSNKLAILNANQFALGYLYNDIMNKANLDASRCYTLGVIDDGISRNISHAININVQDINIYSIMYNKLVYLQNTGNASILFSVTNELNALKKQTRNRY